MGTLFVLLCLSHGADIGTFELAANRGAVEINPMQAHGMMYGVHGAALGAEIAGAKKLAKTNPKRAKWMLVAAIAAEGSITAWNLHVYNQLGRR